MAGNGYFALQPRRARTFIILAIHASSCNVTVYHIRRKGAWEHLHLKVGFFAKPVS